MRSHRIDVGNIVLNVREVGNGPLAVFLHGITANAAVWDPVLDRMGEHFRAVAVDQRGHGQSDKPQSGYGAADFAGDVRGVIQALGGGPALVVGHSLGARNAVVSAAWFPELVSGVVAIDFAPFIEEDAFEAVEKRIRGGYRVFGSRREVEDYLSDRYPRMPRDAIERRAEFGFHEVAPGSLSPLAPADAMVETHRGIVTDDFEAVFRDVPRPALLIRGADSSLLSSTAFQRALEARPDFEGLVVPDADHYVPEEQPDVVSTAILDFAGRNCATH